MCVYVCVCLSRRQEVEVEPVVFSRTIARADGWAIWQLEITLAEGAEARWREAAALGVAAVERLAARRLPPTAAAEAAALSEATWRWSSRAPTAVELSYDLQSEPAAEWAVAGARTFVGEPAELAASVDAVAAQLARSSPVVTLWASDLEPLGVDPLRSTPPLPAPLAERAQLVPLRLGSSLWASSSRVPLRAEELTPPPPNRWVPSSFAAPAGRPMERRGYRFRTAGAAGGGQPAESGVRVVQLPGCIAMGRLGVAGNKKALADVECVGTADYRGGGGARPFASAVLQVESLRPAAAGPKLQARGELWRLTLLQARAHRPPPARHPPPPTLHPRSTDATLHPRSSTDARRQALAPTAAAAAVAGLKLDVSYNVRGVRLVVSGYAQKVPRLLLLALRRTLRHMPVRRTSRPSDPRP